MTLTTAEGVSVPVKLIDNHDRTYRVEFEPTTPGTYKTNVMFAGQRTPDSPYTVNVQPPAVDTSKVRVTDMPQGRQHTHTAGIINHSFDQCYIHPSQ